MSAGRLRPQKKIDELLLLLTIRDYDKERGHMGWPPTAWNLFDLKLHFAPSLARIDTLRQWLLRHRGRTIRILPHYRPFRYELTRQGERRIAYLQNLAGLIEDFNQKLSRAAELQAQRNNEQLMMIKREIDRRDEENRFLWKVIEILLKALPK